MSDNGKGNSYSNWGNNNVQFPRLLAEINATQEIDFEALVVSMDLSVHHIKELFERAQTEWEQIKRIEL